MSALFLLAMSLLSVAVALASAPDVSTFATESEAAMKKMMVDMEVKPSGDADRDFVAMMIPHHQGAIDGARPTHLVAISSSRPARRPSMPHPSKSRRGEGLLNAA